MSEAKKITVSDLMGKLDEVSKNMADLKERNEYMVLRCEGLLKALLNADELPDLSPNTAKPPKANPEDGTASDLFGSSEVPI